jgi:hypothetical protein
MKRIGASSWTAGIMSGAPWMRDVDPEMVLIPKARQPIPWTRGDGS